MVAKAAKRGFLMLVIIVTASNGDNIMYDIIESVVNMGPSPVSILNIIRNSEELNEYCSAVRYDTAELPVKPDFTENSIIALLSMSAGGSSMHYRQTQQIVDEKDTIFLEIIVKIKEYPGMLISAGHQFTFMSIPRTDKPVDLRILETVSIAKPIVLSKKTQFTDFRSYDIQGRLIPQRNWKNPHIVIFSKNFVERRRFFGAIGLE